MAILATAIYGSHQLVISHTSRPTNFWITHDGKEVYQKNIMRPDGVYKLSVMEDGNSVFYEVSIGGTLSYKIHVKRDGVLIYSTDKGFVAPPTEPVQSPKKTNGAIEQTKKRKKVLGVLKSFPRISIADLSKYSGEPMDYTRDMLFELIGDNLVSGRFDPASDEFISAEAAIASKEIKSDTPSLARCVHCGKSLERALISGDEVVCPSCGMVNIG